MITYRDKDLLKVTRQDGVIVTPVNSVGVLEGVTKGLCQKYPANRRYYDGTPLNPGSVVLITAKEVTIANLVVQVFPGWPMGNLPGDLAADRLLYLRQGLKALAKMPDTPPLWIPYKIGCYGPCTPWESVYRILEESGLEINVAVPRWAVWTLKQKHNVNIK